MKKLSKTQQECLNHLKENKTFLHFMSYFGSYSPSVYYFARGTMKRFRERTVTRLIKLGYLERYDNSKYNNDHKVRLKTEARNG